MPLHHGAAWLVGSTEFAAGWAHRARLFCIHRGQLMLLHGIVKKTEKTPDNDLDLAMKRKREVER